MITEPTRYAFSNTSVDGPAITGRIPRGGLSPRDLVTAVSEPQVQRERISL